MPFQVLAKSAWLSLASDSLTLNRARIARHQIPLAELSFGRKANLKIPNVRLYNSYVEGVTKAARLMGRRSVQARVKAWGKREFTRRMQEWGKLGGRPKGSVNKKAKKEGK